MSERTTPDQRRSFLEQHTAGLLYRQIADAAHVSLMCVRYWCRRLSKGHPAETMYTRQPRGILQTFHPLVRYVLLRLRREHQHWGPSRLRFQMSKRPSLSGLRLPCAASIGYYLHQWEKFRRPLREETPTPRPNAPTRVHEEWQVDYKMDIPIADGVCVHLLDIRDPVGAAVIGSFQHPGGQKGRRPRYLTFPEVRADLRLCFARWQTLPDRIQTDNEGVFIGKPHSEFPSLFVLWLKGLGVEHVGIQPGKPTENAHVERQHRTVHDYGLVGCTASAAEIQTVLDQAMQDINRDLPSRAQGCHGRPPLSAHPELLQPRRSFSPVMELAVFDLRRVDAYLATLTWKRKVGKKGQVNLGGQTRKYLVGREYAGQRVVARFDHRDRTFVFYDGKGDEIRRHPCRGLSTTDITGFDAWPAGPGVQQLTLPLDFS